MTLPFVDQSERDYEAEQDATDTREHLKLVHSAMAGGEEYAEADVERMAKDFSDVTCSANFMLAYLARTSEKFPDFSQRVRDLLDALVGATGGVDDYVEVKDEDLAAAMGCSTRTVQNARNELRTWPEYTKLVRIKDHYQTPEGESHPHAYHVLLTRHAAETTLEARLSPGADDFSRRREIYEGAGKITARSLRAFVAKPPKRRKKQTDAQLLASELEQAARRLRSAAQRHGGDIEQGELARLRGEVADALAEFDAAFGFQAASTDEAPRVSTCISNKESKVETDAGASPDVSEDERRVETPDDQTTVSQFDEADGAKSGVFVGVEKFSGLKTVHFSDEAGPPEDLSEFAWMEPSGHVAVKYPPRAGPLMLEAINAYAKYLEGRGACGDA